MFFRSQIQLALVLACPCIPVGDGILRHDIQRLAAAGVIKGPTTIWPLARVRDRANWQTRTKAEVGAGIGWIDDWFSVDLNVQGVDPDQDRAEFRADDNLILSNNARPIPSWTIDRIFTDAFETKWLSWLGRWDFSVMFGQLEKERAVPNAQFFGMRFNFKPMPSLEIGLSRTAQWCGDGRPCDAGTFADLFLGRDNVGDAGTSCDLISDDIFNCAYRQSIYQSDYSYRGRIIGHGADNDARLVSVGWIVVDDSDSQWRALLRFGDLHRGGAPDFLHTLTPTPHGIASLDISHSRVLSFGVIDIGAGYDDVDSGTSLSESRIYAQWRSSY